MVSKITLRHCNSNKYLALDIGGHLKKCRACRASRSVAVFITTNFMHYMVYIKSRTNFYYDTFRHPLLPSAGSSVNIQDSTEIPEDGNNGCRNML